MPSVIPVGIAAEILGRAGRVAQRPCADPGSGGEVSRRRATLGRGWQWTLRWRGGPRAGEGAAEQRSSGVTGARAEEAEKIELTRGAGPSAEASARCAGLGRVRGGDAWARLSARGVARAG